MILKYSFCAMEQVRGDPDGCGLDVSLMRYSPSDLRVDLPAEDLLNIKRGWLMKQGQDKVMIFLLIHLKIHKRVF